MHASARLGGHDTIPGALLESRVFRFSRMREFYARSLVIAEIRDYLQTVWKCIFAYHLQSARKWRQKPSQRQMKTQEYGADGLKETTRNALSPSLLLKPNIDSQCSIYEKFIFLCSAWIHVFFFYTESWTGGSKLSRSIFAPVSSVVVCVVPSPCNSINLLTEKKMTPVIEHQGVITNLFQWFKWLSL